MWDDKNDKKIKEAADQYHPAYDENAWKKMEQMLDKHLPQKKGRRRIILFIPLLLLTGALLYFGISHQSPTRSSELTTGTALKNNSEKQAPSNVVSGKDEKNNAGPTSKEIVNISETKNTEHVSIGSFQKNSKEVQLSERKAALKYTALSRASFEENITKNPGQNVKNDEAPLSPESEIAKTDSNMKADKVKDIATTAPDKTEKNKVVNTEKNQDKTVSKKATNLKNRFQKKFGISFSAGPDISGVSSNDAGKITLSYGLGVAYNIAKKFTIRSGFYVSKKIYSTDSYSYHLPTGTPNNYLDKVSANCKVYEIPLKLSYNFGKVKNHNWFASAGLSSYLMKKEAYSYLYKYPGGGTYTHDWAIQNKNQHFFSLLDLSGGYQYNLSKRFSIMAEPYVSIPLSGVGAGKVKLNSGGILFTLGVKPF